MTFPAIRFTATARLRGGARRGVTRTGRLNDRAAAPLLVRSVAADTARNVPLPRSADYSLAAPPAGSDGGALAWFEQEEPVGQARTGKCIGDPLRALGEVPPPLTGTTVPALRIRAAVAACALPKVRKASR